MMTFDGPKLDKTRQDKIIGWIKKNLPYKVAAEASGICEKTFYNWLNKGREDRINGIHSDYVEFLDTVKNAEAELMASHVSYIEAGGKEWQSKAWILERRWRQLFGKDAQEIEELKMQMDDLKALINSAINKQ